MKIVNRVAYHEYQIFDKFEVGVVLLGAEVKSLMAGQASLAEAYIKRIGTELFLINAHIHPYQFAGSDQDPKRTRKLLMKRKEILNLVNQVQQKRLAIIPLSWYNKGRKIKLEVALAKGKKSWQKRETLKQRDIRQDAVSALTRRG